MEDLIPAHVVEHLALTALKEEAEANKARARSTLRTTSGRRLNSDRDTSGFMMSRSSTSMNGSSAQAQAQGLQFQRNSSNGHGRTALLTENDSVQELSQHSHQTASSGTASPVPRFTSQPDLPPILAARAKGLSSIFEVQTAPASYV